VVVDNTVQVSSVLYFNINSQLTLLVGFNLREELVALMRLIWEAHTILNPV
jgi:hypothetical protein